MVKLVRDKRYREERRESADTLYGFHHIARGLWQVWHGVGYIPYFVSNRRAALAAIRKAKGE
jgi:hypothetical protein